MDFSIAQKGNTSLCYILPFFRNRGTVEYTFFSGKTASEKYPEYWRGYKNNYLKDDLGH